MKKENIKLQNKVNECYESFTIVDGIIDDIFYQFEHQLRLKDLEKTIKPSAARKAMGSIEHAVIN